MKVGYGASIFGRLMSATAALLSTIFTLPASVIWMCRRQLEGRFVELWNRAGEFQLGGSMAGIGLAFQ